MMNPQPCRRSLSASAACAAMLLLLICSGCGRDAGDTGTLAGTPGFHVSWMLLIAGSVTNPMESM